MLFFAEQIQKESVKYTEVISLKKTIAICLFVIFLLSANVGCTSSQSIDYPQNPENAENPQTPNAPNARLPQVMIDDVIYMLYGDPYLGIENLPESYYKGQILSTVSLTEVPIMNGEANFNVEVGTPYAIYGDGFIVLWNGVWTLFVTENALTEGAMPTPRIVGGTPEKAPKLDVSLLNKGIHEQRVETLQLTTSWSISYEDGTGTGYEADSPHPLQLRQTAFTDATLYFTNTSAEIALHFSDDYPPLTITVQRWPSEYAYDSQDIQEHLGNGEHVTLSGSSIHVDDDGHNYIYEVSATWLAGRSFYTFRMFTGRQHG